MAAKKKDLTPEERTMRAKLAAAALWGKLDEQGRREHTAPARRTFTQRFTAEVRSEFPDASDEDVAKMALHRLRAHMIRVRWAALRPKPEAKS